MFKNLLRVLIAVVITATTYSAASATDRVALVIGNSRYLHLPRLAVPVNDAIDMTATLQALGFEVVSGIDLTKSEMDTRIGEFHEKAAEAKLALLFYDGHGLQVDDTNFFLPIDSELKSRTAIDFEAISADSVMRDMSSPTRPGIVLIDASRANKFASALQKCTRCLFAGRGLAAPNVGDNMLIVFATSPEQETRDGSGRNSAFTAALLKHLPESGAELRTVMRKVKAEVRESTQDSQDPWYVDSILPDVYLNAVGGIAPPP